MSDLSRGEIDDFHRHEIQGLRAELKKVTAERDLVVEIRNKQVKRIQELEAERESWGNEFTAVVLAKERIERLSKALLAAVNALRSYQYGNAATELAQEIADFGQDALEAK